MDTYALTYHDAASHEWWFIPTVPEARKWRGPFVFHMLERAIVTELGADVTITQTKVRPDFLGDNKATLGRKANKCLENA